ncbi:MAG: hypothetical protein WC073_13440 [Sterolibacterium sp.]
MLNTIFQRFLSLATCLVALGLAGCVSGGGEATTTTTVAASVSIALTDPATNATLTNLNGKPAKVSATVRDTLGAVVPNVVVTFSTDATLASMSQTTALTDSAGVATIQISPATLTAAGATTISAATTVGSTPVTGSLNFGVLASSAGIDIKITNLGTGGALTQISTGTPAKVSATVRDASGPVANTVVTFATAATLATMTPATGTALTDSDGVAWIRIDAANPSAAGAATITATASVNGTTLTGSASFSVKSTTTVTPGIKVTLNNPSISPSSSATVSATITNASGVVPPTVVTFATNPALATMTPTTGTALTNASGVATIRLDAASLTAAGATTISATATVDGASMTDSIGFSVSAANAGLANMTVGTTPLSPYATTNVSVTVTGVPTTTPVTINFSSICAGTGKATLPASVQSVNGVATATYTDKGCASTDTITASVAGLAVSATTTLPVSSPGAASIQFVSATPTTIVLKGTGGAGLVESSLVRFKVVDNNNVPVTGADVRFDLTTWAGGILLDGSSAALSKKTDSNGEATVSVQSGTTPTAVWVKATVTSASPSFSSQSNQLRISTGRPAQDRFSLSLSSLNIEGYNINGVTTTLNVIASDRLGNPVPDGTAINFISEGAQIEPSCATVSGTCSVKFTSANPRPTGDTELAGIVTKGRATVVAYTLGEESFTDLYGDNVYHGLGGSPTTSLGTDPFNDLGDVFIDNNEDGVWQAGEQSIAFKSTNNSACSSGIATSPPAPSKAGTCDGVWGSAHVRQDAVIVLSGSSGYVNSINGGRPTAAFIPGATTPVTTFSMGGATKCSGSFQVYVFDQNRNPLPVGTALASVSPPTSLGTVSISPASVQNTNTPGGTAHTILISKPSTTNATTGAVSCVTVGAGGVPLNFSMTTPSGAVSTVTFTITD